MKARSAADARHQNEREQYEQIEHKATHAEREKDAADDRIEELYAQARASAAQA